jgi:N-acetylmuramoyl-L-alanine amidase
VFELNQNKHLDQSIQFAQTVQSELVSTAHRKDNGVRQAGFWVLMATSMPAVLVELDFICNPQSEAYLSSAEGQRQLSKSIVDAVKTYHSGNKSAHATPSTKPTVTEPVAATAPVDKQTPSNKQAPVDNDKRDTKVSETSAPKQADHSVSKTTPTDKAPQGLTYRIQILASDKKVKTTSAEFKGQSDITEYTEKGLYKYTVGDYSSMDEANAALRTVRKKFPQAFVIKWNGARVY